MNISLLAACQTSRKVTATLINVLILWGLMPYGLGLQSVNAQTSLACQDVELDLLSLANTAAVSYQDRSELKYRQPTNGTVISANPTQEVELPLRLVSLGVEDLAGNTITGLGAIALDLTELFQQQGLEESAAQSASLQAIARWAELLPETSSAQIAEAVKQEVAAGIEEFDLRDAILELNDSELITVLGGYGDVSLQSLGLPREQLIDASETTLEAQSVGAFDRQIQTANQATAERIDRPEAQALLSAARGRSRQELTNLRLDEQSPITAGSRVKFRFRLDNQQDDAAKITLPNAATITKSGLTGAGTVTGVTYRIVRDEENEQTKNTTQESELVSIPAQTSLELDVEVEVEETSPTEVVSLGVELQPECGSPISQALNILPPIGDGNDLIDPLGQLTGCAGEILADYKGFSIALYDPDPSDPTGSSVLELTSLTETELPDKPDNKIPQGVEPNTQNSNPFFLVNSDEGRYSFLFDSDRQQLERGATYILLVTPPTDSEYDERRVKLEIGDRVENVVEYTATSLDGKPIRASDGQNTITGEFLIVEDAETVGLDLAVLGLSSSVCDAQEIQITKTGDRATAEPGDIVLYRLAVRNLASAPITELQITDTLPAGFRLERNSIKAEVDEAEVNINLAQNGRTINLSSGELTLESNATINLVYAAEVTPNALRGSGRNSAIVNGQRTDNNLGVQAGPAIHNLRLEPGIVEDAGTLIGRVFVDKNFDGEQQPGEPGIPNAVIYLEDGNRVITDADGLFSVTNVLPGVHTGILDLTSIPEYNLAPNIQFIERNSNSRLVQLEPGGMVRMNFGVTPTAGEIEESNPQPASEETKPEETKPNTRN